MDKIKNSIAIFLLISSSCVLANPDFFVDKESQVQGLYQHDYVNMWWQWAVSMNDQESPVIDRKGNYIIKSYETK